MEKNRAEIIILNCTNGKCKATVFLSLEKVNHHETMNKYQSDEDMERLDHAYVFKKTKYVPINYILGMVTNINLIGSRITQETSFWAYL
jgi:hypothetical protein